MEVVLNDNEQLGSYDSCEHKFTYQANVNVEGIIWDVYFCSKCLLHVKKERPCPYDLNEIY